MLVFFRKVISTILSLIVIIFAAGDVAARIPETGSVDKLNDGDKLWRAGKFHESQNIYMKVANNASYTELDRIGALQRLALQAWLEYGKADSSLALLNRAIGLGKSRSTSYSMMSRFLLHDGFLDSAVVLSKNALSECRQLSDSLQTVMTYGEAVFEREKEAFRVGRPLNRSALKDAAQKLNAIGSQAPSETYVWELALGLAILRNDGQSALIAWRRYFGMAPEDSSLESAGELIRIMTKVLPAWNSNKTDYESCRALVKALAASRLFGHAKLIAVNSLFPDGEKLRHEPEIIEIIAYADFIEEARGRINSIYRKRLTKDSTVTADIQEFLGSVYGYWQNLEYSGERPEFSTDEIGAQLSKRWGAVFSAVDFSPSNFEITWGHSLYEDVRPIEQYGHKAEVRLTMLDQMVSSGMMEWLTDGDVQVGGWAPAPPIVYRVRPAYFTASIRAWEKVTYPEKRLRIENRINDLRAVDDSLAKADPYAYLPGTGLRMWYAGLKGLHDSLVSSGLSGERLRRTFLLEYERLTRESAIIAHEGRHIIDMTFYSDEFETWDAARVEFSAKLSEILFSPNPWFSIGTSAAVFYSSFTDSLTSGHDRASYLMRKCLVDWMEQHMNEITGFDRARPTLPQIDLLSTEQLLTALKTADPAARQ